MIAYRLEKRGNFYKAFSSLKALNRLPITTPLGRKAITAAKFAIAIILLTALLLFSTKITAQEYVEFNVNEGINLSNAFVRVSSNDSHLDIPATELLLNQTISLNLSSIDIPKVGTVYIDLISNGEIIDSRKVAINNDKLSLMPANETITDNIKKTAAIDIANKNINAQKPKHNKIYNLNSNGKELSLEIDGIYDSPLVQTLEGQTANLNNESIELNTDIIAVNESEFDKATIVLPKNGNVNKLLKCQEWDFNAASCKGSWAVSDIPFEQNSTHIWFTVNSFSGYAGAEITIIDVYAYPKEGDMWTVRFNTTGKANLTITPINNTNWTEFLQDSPVSKDEISFESLKCGNTALNNSILVDDGTSLRAFNSIGASESITVNRLIIPDYECNETSAIRNLVHIPGYASLMFQFGNDIGYAYDPSCTDCSTCSALATTNGNTINLSNSITITNTTPCIEVRANNTRIHCNGFTLNGTSLENSRGIFINSQYNTTIKDCNISQFHYGIYLQNSINDTTILNNTLDNLTFGVYLSINDTAFVQYRTNIDFNKFYNTTTAVFSTTAAAIKYSTNITNNTILLARNAFTGAYTQENIIRNNTINATTVNIGFEGGFGGTWLRNNVTHNIFLNNGTFAIDAADLYCIDVGNYYQTVKAANGRPKEDCGPHPALGRIRVNETASNNATFSSNNSNVVSYNHPIIALGNANWNGSALVQFVSGSRQFNLSRDGDDIFYSKNVGNTTFDCNGAVIWANQTSLAIQDWTNDAIGNCTIINATRGLNIINTASGPGSDNNTIKDNLIRNVSYGIYIDAGTGSLANNNHIENNIIRNVSTIGIFTTPSGGSTTALNITNNTIEEAVDGIELVGSSNGLITNNSVFGSSNPIILSVGSGASFNNVTRNNFSGGPSTTDVGSNKFCLDVGNAYLDEAAAASPGFGDCGPTPNVREIMVDTSNSINRFEFGISAASRVNYSSLVVAAANAGNDTVIIVVNSTSNPFNGSIFMRYKFNVTIDCNSTRIIRNATGQAVGIDMRNTARGTVRNCNISNFDQTTAAGIHMTANNQSVINNVTFYLPGTYGIDAASGTAHRINITGSKFVRFTGGVRASGDGNLYWRFEGNTFNNNTDGILLNSDGGLSYSTVLNNTFYGNVNNGIDMQATLANESTFEFNNFTLNGYGIRIGGGGGIIRNNITNNSFFIHTTRGLSFDDTSSSGNNVVNNTFSSTNASSADTGNDNFFNNSRIGNHWLEYDQSAEGCVDAGGDGFCDTNYSISGSSAESDFLPFSINEVSNCNTCSGCSSTSNTDGRIVNITGNLTLNGIGACINVGNNNTIIQCNGFVISGNNSIDSIGIRINEQKNTTIRNCTISSFHYGIYILNNVTDTSLLNDTFDNSTYGIFSDVNGSSISQYRTVVYANTFNNASYSVYFDPPSSGSLYRQNNITNSTFLLSKEGLNGTSIRETIVKNNTINASFIGIGLDGSNSQRNNVTRNIFMNGTVSANPDNFFCLDVGNAYLSNKYNQMQPVIGDCGPTPFIGEIRVDSSKTTNFSFGATDKNSVVYPGLRLAAANSNNHTNIIVVNQTSINFTGAIQLDFKFNVTINCNGTTISGNVESVTTGIDLSDTQGATIKYCNISGFNGGGNNDGIEIRRANQTVIDNVTFSTPGSTGIFVASGNVSRVNITNSTFKWFGTAGIIMNTTTNSTFSWRIERNYFTNITGQAISIGGGGYHTVRNNTFFGNGNAIEWGPGGIMSNESTYELNNFTLNNYGILTSGEATRNNVTNNSFFRHNTSGVNIAGNAPTGNVFSNNTFNGTNATSSDSGNDNYFNDSRQGNHWTEYDQLAEGCNDTNGNRLCDSQYNLTGNSSEADFLPFALNTAPSTLLISPNGTLSNSSTVQFICNGTDSESLSNMTVYANFSGTFAANTTAAITGTNNQSRINISGIPDGNYIWNCLVKDAVNLEAFNTTVNFTISVDTRVPSTVTLNTPANSLNTTLREIEFNFSAIDNQDTNITCNLTLNGAVNKTKTVLNGSSNSNTVNISGLADNTYLWNFTCYDNANNSNTSETRQFIVDNVRPSLNLSINDSSLSLDVDSVFVAWNATDTNLNNNYANVTFPNGSLVNQFTSRNFSLGPNNLTLTGTYNVTVYATDAANNNNITSVTFSVNDTTNPAVILIGPANDSFSAIKNVSFVCNATNSALSNISLFANLKETGSFTVNATQNISGTVNRSNFTVTGIADGNYFWNCLAKDASNNQAFNTTNYTITIDTTVPSDVTLNSQANGFNSSSVNVLFNISAADNLDTNLTCNITLDGTPNNKTLGVRSSGSNSSTITINGIAEGNHLWNVTCYDNANNSNVSATNRLTVDTTRPALNLSINDSAPAFNVESIFVAWNATDTNLNNNYANVTFPNGSLVSQFTSRNFSLGPNNLTLTGTYNVTVYATDGANNNNITSVTFSVNDTTNPTVLLISPGNSVTSPLSTVSFVCNATNDALSNISLFTDVNGSWSSNATQARTGTANQSNFTVTGIGNGTFIWNCLAKDASNNEAFNSTNYTIVVDTAAPYDITLNQPTQGLNISSSELTVSMTAKDNLDSNITCNITLDGTVNKTLGVPNSDQSAQPASTIAIVNISEGNHLLNATCYDNGNLANTSATRRFTLDTTRPALNLSINDSALAFNIDSIFVAWNATDTNLNDNYANVTYPNGSLLNQFTNKNFSLGPNNLTLTGTYNVTVYATDGANNNNITSTTFSVTDNANPTVILISPANDTLSGSRNVSFVCNATNDALSNISLFTDLNGSWSSNATQARTGTANQSNFTVTGIPDGTFLWNCLVKDASNNQAFNTTNYTISIDTSPPTNFNLAAPDEGYSSTSTTVEFNFSATDNQDTNLTCNVTVDNTIAARINVSNGTFRTASMTASVGSHQWNVTCYDNVPNRNTSITRNFTINAPASEPAPTGGGGAANGGGAAAPPAPEPEPAPVIVPPPVLPPEPVVQPEPVLPPIEDVLPGVQAEPVISSGLSGILEGVEAVQVVLSSARTKEGVELKFGGKGKIKLSAIEKKPKIIIEFGDDDFELSIPQYTEPVAFTSMLLLMLLLLTILVHGSVHHAYEKYASRLTETKKSAIRHLKSVISEADKNPKPSTIDKCMSIFSIYLAKELSIDKATYKASLKAIKERNKDAAHEFTKIYKEFARKQGKEITKKELKNFTKNIIGFIKRL